MKTILLLVFSVFVVAQSISQTCYTISNRTNGNGNPATCGSPNCSGNAKTGHIDVSFGASCPGIIPSLVLVSVTSGALPSPFCFDPGNCISAGTVRYCFRGNNLPASGSMVLRLTQGASVWNCSYNVSGGGGTVLPIQLSFFDTKLEKGSVHINWQTEQEHSNEKFEIERSGGYNEAFTVIAAIPGQGNSTTPVNYSYTDAAPLKGLNFYRLKQTDADGRFSYSIVKRIDNRISNLSIKQVFPNPARQKVTIQLTVDKPSQLTAKIVNTSGQQVFLEHKTFISGEQLWQMNLHRLTAGIYELFITDQKGDVLAERLVVQ
jgi:hypothetical protein